MDVNALKKYEGFKLTKRKEMTLNYSIYKNTPMNDIYDVYKCPSMAKRESYFSWIDYLSQFCPLNSIKVLTHNTHFYTLGAMAQLEDGIFFVYITPYKRYLYPVYTNIFEKEGIINYGKH